MADEQSPHPGATVGALFRAVEELRADMREDLGHLRDDMREDNAALEHRVMTAIGDFTVTHGREHTTEREASAAVHHRFDEFVKTAELNQARRDGALGVFRYGVEQLSRHAGPLVKVLLAAGALIATASGAIRFEVVIR